MVAGLLNCVAHRGVIARAAALRVCVTAMAAAIATTAIVMSSA